MERVSKKPVKSFFDKFAGREDEKYDVLEHELRGAIGESSKRAGELKFPREEAIADSPRGAQQVGAQPEETNELIAQLRGVQPSIDSPVEQSNVSNQPDVQSVQEPTRAPSFWSSMSESDKDALWVGATPLLAGLLTGNMGGAYEASSKGLDTLAKWQMDKEKALAKKKADGILKDKQYGKTAVTFEDRSGGHFDPKDGTYHDAQGNVIKDPKIKRGLSREDYRGRMSDKTSEELKSGKLLKPITTAEGQKGFYNPVTNSVLVPKSAGLDLSGLTPRLGKLVDKRVTEYNVKATKNSEGLRDMRTALEGMNTGQLGSKMAVMGLVKTIETRLSDYDREYYAGNVSTARGLKERLGEEKSGKLKPRLIKEARELLNRSIAKSEAYGDTIRGRYTSQLSANGVKDPDRFFGAKEVSKLDKINEEIEKIKKEMGNE